MKIMVYGADGVGKTTLCKALASGNCRPLKDAYTECEDGITKYHISYVDNEITLIDAESAERANLYLLSVDTEIDAALLVADARKGLTDPVRELTEGCIETWAQNFVVFFNGCENIRDIERIKTLEAEAETMLEEAGHYDGAEMFAGSALLALNEPESDWADGAGIILDYITDILY